ncbi:hypothetical protein FO519_009994 [Halicephalobus sp. NKZ332]|nr:hypothetical protein FO519_009994 [Halicephalobus sp. NKZ332]
MEFLYFFLLLLGLTRAYTDPKCLQVDIAFSISTGNTAIPSYLNTTVRDFVKTIANAFSTPDEVPPGSRQFARFSFYTDSIGSDFMDYTRQQLNEKIEPTIACYDNCGDPDYSFYTLFSRLNNLDGYQDSPSLTTNRVGIIITDEM